MKLLTRRKFTENPPVVEEPTPAKEERKSHKNSLEKLGSDEYTDLIPVTVIPIDEMGSIHISVKRGGELGLPKVDIRYFSEVYKGYTKKGINFDLSTLPELNTLLAEVEEMCSDMGLFEEFEVEEESE